MLTILPLFAFLFLFLIFYTKNCWRSSFLKAAIVWASSLTIITEFLSFFKSLTFSWLLIVWSLISIGLLFLYYRLFRQVRSKAQILKWNKVLNNLSLRILFFGIISIVITVGLIAMIAPPNTMDSMSYHMPRVMHWIQNHSVEHYPTSFTPQLFLAPWTEFAILHLQVLSSGDQYANMIQWFSMIGSILGTSLIAKQLGAKLYGQTFSAVLCATIPMGILQASSTKNDYVLAFWLTCMVYHILLTIKAETSKGNIWEIGLSLGLASLTKPTAYLYAFPFLIWLLFSKVKSLRWQLWKPITQIAILALSINIFHFLRNLELFHNLLGTNPVNITYKNQIFGFSFFLSNVIKNLALHISTPIPSFNRFLIKCMSTIHSVLNVDINDLRISSSDFQINSLVNHEDLAGNQLHLLLIIISIVSFYIARKKIKITSNYYYLFNYLLSIIVGFSLFCLILAWTPFNTRLHLSLFVLSSAFVGSLLSIIWSSRLIYTVACIFILAGYPWVLFNENRPLIANSKFITSGKVENIFNTTRIDQYFITRPDLNSPYKETVNFLKSQQCHNIGLAINRDPFEYPLWVLLQEDKSKAYRIQHIDVKNESLETYKNPPYNNFIACTIFDIKDSIQDITYRHDRYTQEIVVKPISIFTNKTN